MLDERVAALERSLLETGLHAEGADALLASVAGDADARSELEHVAEEALWQLREGVLETRRRMAASGTEHSPGATRWLARAASELLSAE